MKSSRVFLAMMGAALAAMASACAGHGASGTGPSDVSAAGATVRGTVAAGASASTAGTRVSVVGTSLSTLADGSGRYLLAAVPPGEVAIGFKGPGFEGQVGVGTLSSGQTVTLDVQVAGGSVVVVSGSRGPDPTPTPRPSASPEAEAEFTGRIESIGSSQLVVAGRPVTVDAHTTIEERGRAIAFSDLRVGDTVEVDGTPLAGGGVLARKIQREDPGNDDNIGDDNGGNGNDDNGGDDHGGNGGSGGSGGGGNGSDDRGGEVKLTGSIQSTSPLMVAGRRIVISGSTRILDKRGQAISAGDLKVGQKVEVEGTAQSDQSVLASKIKIED